MGSRTAYSEVGPSAHTGSTAATQKWDPVLIWVLEQLLRSGTRDSYGF